MSCFEKEILSNQNTRIFFPKTTGTIWDSELRISKSRSWSVSRINFDTMFTWLRFSSLSSTPTGAVYRYGRTGRVLPWLAGPRPGALLRSSGRDGGAPHRRAARLRTRRRGAIRGRLLLAGHGPARSVGPSWRPALKNPWARNYWIISSIPLISCEIKKDKCSCGDVAAHHQW